MSEELVAIARIVKPRGLRGECVADILTDFPERFEETGEVTAKFPNGDLKTLVIGDFRFQKDRILLKFDGIDDVDAAEALRGCDICVDEDATVELEEGEFFDWELEGCRVELESGESIGEVRELMRTGGTEILVVRGESKDYLIPFAESICTVVDTEAKLIRIDPPAGLLDF